MTALQLRFALLLDTKTSYAVTPHGPLFHRWLPDGEKDAITFKTGDSNAELKIWFERRGYTDKRGFIKYDGVRKEVDAAIVRTQGVLDAGPLFGSLRIMRLTDKYLRPLREGRQGDRDYVELGNRVVKLLHPPIAQFLDILRTNFGQRWLPSFNEWDSSRQSLGSYCSGLQLDWSLDSGSTWERFRPDKNVFNVQGRYSEPDFSAYLSNQDLRDVAEAVQDGYRPSFAGSILRRSQQLSDSGDMAYALIQGITALEVAVSTFLRRNAGGVKSLSKSARGRRFPGQVAALCRLLAVDSSDAELAIDAIDLRNALVHEGSEPAHIGRELQALFRVVASLLDGPKQRFLETPGSNAIKSPDDWNAYNESHHPRS